MTRLVAIQTDITTVEVDAIVNAANWGHTTIRKILYAKSIT